MYNLFLIFKQGVIKNNLFFKLQHEIFSAIKPLKAKVQFFESFYAKKEYLDCHYSHLVSEKFYPELRSKMMSGLMVAIGISTKKERYTKILSLIGRTDRINSIETIRGTYSKGLFECNLIHSSRNNEEAEAEIKNYLHFRDNTKVEIITAEALKEKRSSGIKESIDRFTFAYLPNLKVLKLLLGLEYQTIRIIALSKIKSKIYVLLEGYFLIEKLKLIKDKNNKGVYLF